MSTTQEQELLPGVTSLTNIYWAPTVCQALKLTWASVVKGKGFWLPGGRWTSYQGSQILVGGASGAGKGIAPAWRHRGELPEGRGDTPSVRRRGRNSISQDPEGRPDPLAPCAPGGRPAPAMIGHVSPGRVCVGATGPWQRQWAGRLHVLQCARQSPRPGWAHVPRDSLTSHWAFT